MESEGLMWLAVGLGVVAMGGGITFLLVKRPALIRQQSRRKLLAGGARALGMSNRAGSLLGRGEALHPEFKTLGVDPLQARELYEGTIDGQPAWILGFERDGKSWIELHLLFSERLPGGLCLTQQSQEHTLQALSGTRVQDVLTGDAGFDDKLVLRGTQGHIVRAMMSHPVRAEIVALAGRCERLCILPTRCLMVLPHNADAPISVDALMKQVKALSSLRELLQTGGEPHQRLVSIIQSDPDPWVRRRCVETLARKFADTPGTTQALQDAMQDKDWLVRLAAARALGPDALENFAHMLHVAPRPWPEFVVTAVAELNNPLFLPVLRSAVSVSIPAVLAVGRMRDLESIPRLIKSYEQATTIEHKQAILEVLEQLEASEAQPLLIQELNDPDVPVSLRQTVIQALGTCGDLSVIEHLTPFLRVVVGGGLRSLVQQSISTIQARMGGTEAGWSSHSEPGSRASRERSPGPSEADVMSAIQDHEASTLGAAPHEPRRASTAGSLVREARAYETRHHDDGSMGEVPTEQPVEHNHEAWLAEAEHLNAQLDASLASARQRNRAAPGRSSEREETPDEERPVAPVRLTNHPHARSDDELRKALDWLDESPLPPPGRRSRPPGHES